MQDFIRPNPSRENYWRSVILFGLNSASYKFALGKSLLEISRQGTDFVTLADLAKPYARHICSHLEQSDKQGSSPSSKFLDACREYNARGISENELLEATVALGFVNVIDAFHVLPGVDKPLRFFIDERETGRKGIHLTDELLELATGGEFANLEGETEARWKVVEEGWKLRVPADLLEISYHGETETLVTIRRRRRRRVSGARDVLNGYQKGKCFYCCKDISIDAPKGDDSHCHVDHVIPFYLYQKRRIQTDLDRIWNLVLACEDCNQCKKAAVPAGEFIECLHKRNEYYIDSRHMLNKTITGQMGKKPEKRKQFLNDVYKEASDLLPGSEWKPSS